MKQNRFLKQVILGIIIGVIYVIIVKLLNIPKESFLKYGIFSAIIFIALALLINLTYSLIQNLKLKKIISMMNEKKTDKAIEKLNELIDKCQNKYLLVNMQLLLAACYSDLNKTKKSISILSSIDKNNLKGALKDCYYLNLCSNYFYLNENEKATKIYENNIDTFNKLEKVYKGDNLVVVFIVRSMYYLSKGDKKKVMEYFEKIKTIKNSPRLDYAIEDLEKRLQ